MHAAAAAAAVAKQSLSSLARSKYKTGFTSFGLAMILGGKGSEGEKGNGGVVMSQSSNGDENENESGSEGSTGGSEENKNEQHNRQKDEREVKRQRRKQSNRESARRSRLRKQAECEELGARVDTLAVENLALRNELAWFTEECKRLEVANASL
ncbi:unnamed protein product, partial [Sphagnum compactum]